jgi:hypothetical protein
MVWLRRTAHAPFARALRAPADGSVIDATAYRPSGWLPSTRRIRRHLLVRHAVRARFGVDQRLRFGFPTSRPTLPTHLVVSSPATRSAKAQLAACDERPPARPAIADDLARRRACKLGRPNQSAPPSRSPMSPRAVPPSCRDQIGVRAVSGDTVVDFPCSHRPHLRRSTASRALHRLDCLRVPGTCSTLTAGWYDANGVWTDLTPRAGKSTRSCSRWTERHRQRRRFTTTVPTIVADQPFHRRILRCSTLGGVE